MDYKYLLMQDSEVSEYKDICSLDLRKSSMLVSLLPVLYDAAWRERFDKALLAIYKGKNVRKFYQLAEWINGTGTVWDDENTYTAWNGKTVYIYSQSASMESDLVNRDVLK